MASPSDSAASPSPGVRQLSRREVLVAIAAAIGAIVALYVLVPAIAGLEETWGRIRSGSELWLAIALLFEILSYSAYVVALRRVIGAGDLTIGWGDSTRVTMAGIVASRLFATAGAGGVLVTAWALRRLGMEPRELIRRLSALMVLIYAIFMAALALAGLGLWLGVLSGPSPATLTLVPALFALGLITAALALAALTPGLDTAADRVEGAEGRLARLRAAIAASPTTLGSGVRNALRQVGAERVGIVAAGGWWAFDIAVLGACLAAFGELPPLGVLVCAYFVGMLANALPVPGGVGAVEGGMIGALIGLGVDGHLAIVAVLTYRFFAFWLPIVPGVVAYAQLWREAPAAPR